MTPMLEQYVYWKEKYKDCLLFFRMGDFYEMFFDDAKTAAAVLDIVLTSRSKDSDNAIPMAGVPFHSVDAYLGKLVTAGYRVAICEQMTEPDGRTLVQREVTRIVTPGTWIPENSDSDGHIAAFVPDGKNVSIAELISGEGTLRAGTFPLEQALARISSFKPDEIIVRKGQREDVERLLSAPDMVNIVERERDEFNPKRGADWLCRKWKLGTLESTGLDERDPASGAAAAVLRYLEETQFSQAKHVQTLLPILPSSTLILDRSTQTNLELVEPQGTSLYSILNRCHTPMGKRLLKSWILSPLKDLNEITKRQNSIEELMADRSSHCRLNDLLCRCKDIARSIGRLTLSMGAPSDLLIVKETLAVLPKLKEALKDLGHMRRWDNVPDMTELSVLLSSALCNSVPRFVRDGGLVRDGYDAELDMWRSKARNSSQWLTAFEEAERSRTGIKTLKTGVNKVFGYYIEIPKGNAGKAPAHYVRKQTLVNAERFITEELKEFEKDMFRAESEIRTIEERIYSELVGRTLSYSAEIHAAADFIAITDVLLALAEIASDRKYCRPVMDVSGDFIVKNARHPVIEITLGHKPFTPNDFNFSAEMGQRIAIVTGPNMAGKSTYLRTAALIAVMAHMGSFIPAESARIGIMDRVFTRIGARDELARGQSTFMVEMVETANILRYATDKSLVILDEVGRGTSTYDGLSIAWSVVEYLHGQDGRQARVLFATHYHELTKLAEILPGVTNLSMAVEEGADGVVFLHKVIAEPSDRSYGIEVARLAGVPSVVLRRSKELLEQFEEGVKNKNIIYTSEMPAQTLLFDPRQDAILEELASSKPDEMTPMDALQMVYRLREESRKVLNF